MILYRVRHTTAYEYQDDVEISHNEARLVPRELPHQKLLSHEMAIDPTPQDRDECGDAFGNRVRYFAIHAQHRALRVKAQSVVRLEACAAPDLEASPPWESVRDLLLESRPLPDSAHAFLYASPLVPIAETFREYAATSFTPARPLLVAVRELTARLHADLTYAPGSSDVSTPIQEVFSNRRGVCQDFSHIAVACLRALGLAARYVSGYLETLPPEGRPRLTGADASHAWFSVYSPGPGWVDFDPTNDLRPALQHITLAWGRDYSDVPPLKGIILGGGQHRLKVSVDVERVGGDGTAPA